MANNSIEVLSSSTTEVSEDSTYKCETCGKLFSHNSKYQQHLRSRKHAKEIAKAPTSPTKKAYTEGKIKTTLDSVGICLFCSAEHETIEKSLEHMREKHSFVLPSSDSLKDKSAVLKYLGEKIHIGNICIGCNNYRTGGFKNGQAVQQHMQDKGHTFLELNIFQEEYATFVKHKEQFLKKRQPMTGRISAVMSMKEIEEMKNEEDLDESAKVSEAAPSDVSKSSETGSFAKISSMESSEVLSMHSSSSIASEEKVEAKPKGTATEEEWQDMELHDVEKSEPQGEKTPELLKSSSLSVSEVSSVSGASTVDEHILLDTGELLLSNGKIIGHRMFNYIYKQRLPTHEDKPGVALSQEFMETLKAKAKGKGALPKSLQLSMKNAKMKNDIRAQKKLSVHNI